MPRLPTDKEYEDRFTEYVKSIGCERVDELLPARTNSPRLADYMLWDRTVVAELKCITKDHFSSPDVAKRMSAVLSRLGRSGAIGKQNIVNGRLRLDEKVSDAARWQAFDVFARPIKKDMVEASQQIRSTATHFGLPNFHGLLLLVNLADRRLDRDFLESILRRNLRGHRRTLNFVAFYSPHIGIRLPNGRPASWCLTAMNGPQPTDVMERVNHLMRGWAAYNNEEVPIG